MLDKKVSSMPGSAGASVGLLAVEANMGVSSVPWVCSFMICDYYWCDKIALV